MDKSKPQFGGKAYFILDKQNRIIKDSCPWSTEFLESSDSITEMGEVVLWARKRFGAENNIDYPANIRGEKDNEK